MKRFHIGLDFGTYQTKICIYSLDEDKHTFLRFDNSYFLKSRVALKENGTFDYGNTSVGDYIDEFFYFKIASAEDDDFRVSSKLSTSGIYSFYTQTFSAEFLSTIFLSYVIFVINDYLKKTYAVTQKTGGLIGRLLDRKKADNVEIEYSIELGIPTEWSQEKNYLRRRKFESILIIATHLHKKFNSKDDFLAKKYPELSEMILDIYSQLKIKSRAEFEDKLNELKLKVFPETAAGLSFIQLTKQLMKGYYAILDIGGGSSDISFFMIDSSNKIKYLASESFLVASNNVFLEVASGAKKSKDLEIAEKSVLTKIQDGKWKNNTKLYNALNSVNKKLDDVIYVLFNKRVYGYDQNMTSKFKDRRLIIYGGGANLPILNQGSVLIHDNGNPYSLTIPQTYLIKDLLSEFSSGINILPEDNSWKEHFSILAVSLGLSFLKSPDNADWLDLTDYKSKNFDDRSEGMHPFNEGYFFYKVTGKDKGWIKW